MVMQPNMGVPLPDGIGVIDLGSTAWRTEGAIGTIYRFYTSIDTIDVKLITSYYKPIPIICDKFTTGTTNSQPQTDLELCITINDNHLRIKDDSVADGLEFRAKYSGTLVFYKKA